MKRYSSDLKRKIILKTCKAFTRTLSKVVFFGWRARSQEPDRRAAPSSAVPLEISQALEQNAAT